MTDHAGTVIGGSVLYSVPYTERDSRRRTFGIRGRNRSNSRDGGTESSPKISTRADGPGTFAGTKNTR